MEAANRRAAAWLVVSLLTIGFGVAFVMALSVLPHRAAQSVPDGPTVKVVIPEGHGSGFSIGNGYIVTAAHVVTGKTIVEVSGKDGRSASARVLWADTADDVALLKADDPDMFRADQLACRLVHTGERIRAVGNPLNEDFISTWGHIAGDQRAVGNWREAYVTDITILPGMSGGPVYDEAGEVIGISVGVSLTATTKDEGSVTGMSFIVPSMTICDLLGRSA
ncbi:MAG: trypsin-like peptidase domain-containing protein [Patescibacteria group bacterium]|nr:trypsin-like peptidase domain-containing protein [Patescibacteria group bacterium]